MEDVKQEISFILDDVMTLINFCSTDTKTRQICGSKSFWKRQFDKYNLPLNPTIHYTEAYDWIQLLLKTKMIMDQLDQPMNMNVHIKLNDLLDAINKDEMVDMDYPDLLLNQIGHYPFIIDTINVALRKDDEYSVSLLITKEIEKLPGGDLLDYQDYIEFKFILTKDELKLFLIQLIELL